jgi:hypothetical protein
MVHELRTINLKGVNCFMLKAGSGVVLVETRFKSKRAAVDKKLASEGYKPRTPF